LNDDSYTEFTKAQKKNKAEIAEFDTAAENEAE